MGFFDRKQFGEPRTFMEDVRWLVSESDNPLVAAMIVGVPLFILVSWGYIGYEVYRILKEKP